MSTSLFVCFSMKTAAQPVPHKIIQELNGNQLESQKLEVQGRCLWPSLSKCSLLGQDDFYSVTVI